MAKAKNNIEDIYPLSAIQQAMLFHCLRNPIADPGILQIRAVLSGTLCRDNFQEAWRRVLGRHTALRSSVHYKGMDHPVQVVHRNVELPWLEETFAPDQNIGEEDRIAAVLGKDRALGLDLSTSPVLRGTVARIDDDRTLFVLTCHHVLLDGWSGALVLEEVFELYENLCNGTPITMESPTQFAAYSSWLRSLDSAPCKAFWKKYLADLQPTQSLSACSCKNGPSQHCDLEGVLTTELSAKTSENLVMLARNHGLTMATVMSAAWAIVVSRICSSQDVVFATAVSGRTIDLAGIETIVGQISNVVPIRAQVSNDDPVLDWMGELQRKQAETRLHENVSIAEILAWTDGPSGTLKLESLVLFQNLPTRELAGRCLPSGLTIESVQSGFTSGFPVTFSAAMAEQLHLTLLADNNRLEKTLAHYLLSSVCVVLEGISSGAARNIKDALDLIQDPIHPAAEPINVSKIRPGIAVDHLAVRSPVQVALVQIWQDVLDVDSVGIDDDFFDLGGTSLNALRIVSEVESVIGTKLPATVLLESPTIRKLALSLSDDGWASKWRSLIPIQRGDSRPALFCVHGVFGTFYSRHYRDLARFIGADQPFFGLQSAGHEGLKEMARHYVNEIRAFQPDGPYMLIGNCTGGLIAFEMGRQLHAAGHEVALLALIDTVHPTRCAQRPQWIHANHPVLNSLKGLFEFLGKGDVRGLASRFRQKFLSTSPEDAEILKINHQIQKALLAEKNYTIDGVVVPSEICIFWASENRDTFRYDSAEDLRSLWQPHTSRDLEVIEIECRHEDVLDKPHLRKIAEHIRHKIRLAHTDNRNETGLSHAGMSTTPVVSRRTNDAVAHRIPS